MPYATRVLLAAFVSTAATVAVAYLSKARLADAPTRGRLASDPVGSVASVFAFLIGIAAFFRLGRSIGGDGARGRVAVAAGVLGGLVAGLIGSVAQSLALAGYLGSALATYALPAEFLPAALATFVVIATVGTATVAAAIAYLGWIGGRRSA